MKHFVTFARFSFAQESGINLIFIKMSQPHVNIIYLITMASNDYKMFKKFVSEINERILKLRGYGSNFIKTKKILTGVAFMQPPYPCTSQKNVMQNE